MYLRALRSRLFPFTALALFAALAISCETGPPSINSLSPDSGPNGSVVTIDGSGFSPGGKVLFDGNVVGSIGLDTLLFTVPYDATNGTHDVQVQKGVETSPAVTFTVDSQRAEPDPDIHGYSVQYYALGAAGTDTIMNVILYGTGFDTNSVVEFDGAQVTTLVPGHPVGGLVGAFVQGAVLPGYPAEHYDKAVAAQLTAIEGNLPAAGSSHTARVRNTVTGNVSDEFDVDIPSRDVLVEYDKLTTVSWAPAGIWRNNTMSTVGRAYTEAGIIIDARRDGDVADPKSGSNFTDADVLNFMANQSGLSGNTYTDEWYFHVSLLTTRVEPRAGFTTFGRMFDRDDREGMVVFTSNVGDDSLFMRTLIHEMGHGFNLSHCEGDAVPDRDADGSWAGTMSSNGRTIMNQTRFLTNDWQYQFSADSETHLTTHPENSVAPGSGNLGFNSASRQEGSCDY